VPRLIWSPKALTDVQRLYRFLTEKNSGAAKRAAGAIRDGMLIVADHLDVGSPVDDIDPKFREWPLSFVASGYVTLYRLHQDVALLVAVRHQKEVGYQHLLRSTWSTTCREGCRARQTSGGSHATVLCISGVYVTV